MNKSINSEYTIEDLDILENAEFIDDNQTDMDWLILNYYIGEDKDEE